jgi:transcriptional regulator with XRE-family HTH domain
MLRGVTQQNDHEASWPQGPAQVRTRQHDDGLVSSKRRRGRPPSPLEPSASAAARLGAELRGLRAASGLTLAGLSVRIGYSAQYISRAEHGRSAPGEAFVLACEVELGADGTLLQLLPAVVLEQAQHRCARVAARRSADIHSDQEDNVDPTNRRGLAGAGGAAVLGLGAAATPASARAVDPALPGHWERLLAIIGTHDAAHGPHDVLATTRRELWLITAHRKIAHGDLRTALMRVEARWAVYADATRSLSAPCAWHARPITPTSSHGLTHDKPNGPTRATQSTSPKQALPPPAPAHTHERCAPSAPPTRTPTPTPTPTQPSGCSHTHTNSPPPTAPPAAVRDHSARRARRALLGSALLGSTLPRQGRRAV